MRNVPHQAEIFVLIRQFSLLARQQRGEVIRAFSRWQFALMAFFRYLADHAARQASTNLEPADLGAHLLHQGK
jgi:hypothetical protein